MTSPCSSSTSRLSAGVGGSAKLGLSAQALVKHQLGTPGCPTSAVSRHLFRGRACVTLVEFGVVRVCGPRRQLDGRDTARWPTGLCQRFMLTARRHPKRLEMAD